MKIMTMTSRQYAVDPEKLAEVLGIPKETSNILLAGADHPEYCRCEICKQYWQLIGSDEDGNYGPFSIEEIENEEM